MRIVSFFVLFLISLPLFSQKYNTAIGLRFGNGQYGFSARQRVLPRTTIEGMAVLDPDQYNGTLLLQQHFPLIGRGLNVYTGAGAHLGEQKEAGTFRGFDLVLGAELKAPALPLLISADIKPAYHFDYAEWFDVSAAISAHYIIGKDTRNKRLREKKKKKRLKEKDKKRKDRAKWKRKKEKSKGERSFWDFLDRDKAEKS